MSRVLLVAALFLSRPVLVFADTHDGKGDTPGSRFLLINATPPATDASTDGCNKGLSALNARLGASSVLLSHPDSTSLRQSLLQFGDATHAGTRVIVYCGDARASQNNLFAVTSSDQSGDALGLTAVSARAFSRVVGDNGGVVLDLRGKAGTETALKQAADAWKHDADATGYKFVVVEPEGASGAAVEKLDQSGATSLDALQTALHAMPAEDTSKGPGPSSSASGVPSSSAEPHPAAGEPAPGKIETADAKGGTGDAAEHPATDAAAHVATTGPDAAGAASKPANSEPAAGQDTGKTDTRDEKPPAKPKQRSDPQVRRLQVALLAAGTYHGRVDGIRSPAFINAIKHFQASKGQWPSGVLTPNELKLLIGG